MDEQWLETNFSKTVEWKVMNSKNAKLKMIRAYFRKMHLGKKQTLEKDETIG